MIVEDKKVVNVSSQEINMMTDEAILLLRKLVMMLSPISTTTLMQLRFEATGSNMMDGIGTITGVGGTIPIVTTVNQLGGCGLSIIQNSLGIIDPILVNAGLNYIIGEIVTLSGNSTIIVNSLFDNNIFSIDKNPISGGIGYVNGEIVTLNNGINGKIMISAVDNSGVAIEVSLLEFGYDYIVGVATQLSSTGSGTGLSVNILSLVTGIGPVRTFSVLSAGSNYSIGNFQQIATTGNGVGLVVTILSVDNNYGNNNFLQMDDSRWLYTDMIRNRIEF